MSEEQNEKFFDLLIAKVTSGLDDTDQRELDLLDSGAGTREFESLEMTAAAICLAGVSIEEPMPAYLFSKIADDAPQYFENTAVEEDSPWAPASGAAYIREEPVSESSSGSWFSWLGWAAAAAACIALAINIWTDRSPVVEQAKVPTPLATPQPLTPAQMRDSLMTSPNLIKANWAAGNVRELKQITGDIVWSEDKQTGYMRFTGLPANDRSQYTYQLWIMDKSRDKNPIDGGTFDVSSDGEIIIPINARLKTGRPEMFAVTMEKPGGVVVSDKEKIVALAKVETQAS